ncbi:MAG: sensor histidine kinase [Bacteroidales bacterium]
MSDKPDKSIYCPGERMKGNINSGKDDFFSLISCPSLLSGMSHEMRTHMNSIVAFSFLMNNGNYTDEEKKEFSNHILSSCEQLMFLFDNFFDSAIIDTGNSKVEPKPCNLGDLVNELMSEIRTLLKRHDYKDLVLILENQVHNQEEVYIDTYQVIRVLRNIFQNALSNTKSGYIKIGYRLISNELTFYVLDSGNGFQKSSDLLKAENLQESLQIYNDASAAINLALAKKMITLMGGNIWVERNGASGTGLYFNVPSKKADFSHIQINKYTNTKIAI